MGITDFLLLILLMVIWFSLVRVDIWLKTEFWIDVWDEIRNKFVYRSRTLTGSIELASDLLFYFFGLLMIATPIVVAIAILMRLID